MRVQSQGRELAVDQGFAAEIRRRTGENVFLCYQCRKCSSGCPVRAWMKGSPAELMRYAQMGLSQEALESEAIWYCASCLTCSVRCPAGIDIAHVVDAMRMLAVEKNAQAKGAPMRLLNRLWMVILRFSGRMYEIGLVAALNGLNRTPFKDMALGAKLIAKGKLSLLPHPVRSFEVMKLFGRARTNGRARPEGARSQSDRGWRRPKEGDSLTKARQRDSEPGEERSRPLPERAEKS